MKYLGNYYNVQRVHEEDHVSWRQFCAIWVFRNSILIYSKCQFKEHFQFMCMVKTTFFQSQAALFVIWSCCLHHFYYSWGWVLYNICKTIWLVRRNMSVFGSFKNSSTCSKCICLSLETEWHDDTTLHICYLSKKLSAHYL